MKTTLEVFYLRIVGRKVLYRRKQVSLSGRRGDPDRLIRPLLGYSLRTSAGDVRKEFVVHSTSWRYSPPGRITLTYIAYSDEQEFSGGKPKSITLTQLRNTNLSTGRPRSRQGLERQVVAHAMRHIAFLIKTDPRGSLQAAFTPASRRVFKSLWVDLAGRVF